MPVSEKFVQALKMMREKKGSNLSPEEIAQAHAMMPPDPEEAPVGLQTIDSGLAGASKLVKQGVEKITSDPVMATALKRPQKLLELANTVPDLLSRGVNSFVDAIGVPKGPGLDKLLPKTVQETGFNPNVRDMGVLLAFEGLGRGGNALKAAGERGKIAAFEANKPALPPNATQEMAQAILEQNPSVSNSAGDVLAQTITSLEERGRGASNTAKNISDAVGNKLSPESITQLYEFFPEHPVIKELYDRLDPSKVYARGHLQAPADLSAYEPFSYASRNTHKAWQLDPITKQPMAKNPKFGEMMRGIREELRSNQTPLSESQLQEIKNFNPEFSGSTVGEAIEGLNKVTRETILDQKRLSGVAKERNPLGYMNKVATNLSENAFAKNSKLDPLLEYANKYTASSEHAKALKKYVADNTKNGSGFNSDLMALHTLIGGPKTALVLETAKSITNPTRRSWLMEKGGSLASKLRPSALFESTPSPYSELNLKPTITGE
jgi:hypothetical protein